jgi:hypothetical protein
MKKTKNLLRTGVYLWSVILGNVPINPKQADLVEPREGYLPYYNHDWEFILEPEHFYGNH